MKVPDMVEGCAKEIWDSIVSGDAVKDPSLLNRFVSRARLAMAARAWQREHAQQGEGRGCG